MPEFLIEKQAFLKLFHATAKHANRYEVFADFVKTSAIAIHNAVAPCQTREDEYLAIIKKYSDNDKQNLCHLLSHLINLLEPRPYDVLGDLYGELELTNKNTGQFFTPFSISQLCAKVTLGNLSILNNKPFLTVSDPAVGAGGMLLAITGEVIHQGYDPAQKLFCEGVDVDEVVALCAYLQLSLWNVPSRIVVGNSLTMEYRQQWFTPAYYLFGWQEKLKIHEMIHTMKFLFDSPSENLGSADVVVENEQLSMF